MLVLTRYPKQKIKIDLNGVEIVIDVVQIRGDKVRLGVTAPKEATIDREEIADKIKQIGYDCRKTNGVKE